MRRTALLAPAVLGLLASTVHANIIRWDTGKAIAGTQGITLGAGIDLSGWDKGSHSLQKAALSAADLSGVNFSNSNLSKSRFGATGRGGVVPGTTNVAGANFAGANIAGANLSGAENFTGAQLSSTETFGMNKLRGLLMDDADLTDTNFNGKNLTSTDFESCTLTGATFTGARITKGDFDAAAGFTAAQLASTFNYVHHNLSGINFTDDDIDGISLVKVNLSRTNLTDADLQGATFTKANLTKTNLDDADLRGATGITLKKNTTTHDTIQADGSINGLALGNGETLTVRNNANPVTVKQSATFNSGSGGGGGGSTLEFLLQDNWTSSMDFASGVNPTLGGTLDLTFAPGVDPSTLIGDTFQIFNWNTAPSAGNEFTTINTDPGALWDTSNLYTDGTVTVVAVAGSEAPEPASLGVLSVGLLMLLKRRRRAGDLR